MARHGWRDGKLIARSIELDEELSFDNLTLQSATINELTINQEVTLLGVTEVNDNKKLLLSINGVNYIADLTLVE